MTGFLCGVGIAGSVVFCIGMEADTDDPTGPPWIFGGAALLTVAAVGGVIRLVA